MPSKPTKNRVHTGATLTTPQGHSTKYKKCIDLQSHKVVTYYRHFLQADVCDLCHEGPQWLTENTWRYPDASQGKIRELLGIPEPIVIASPEKPIESLDMVKSSNDSAKDVEVTTVEQCSTCGNVASYVGMEGESLCEICWGIIVSIMGT